MKSKYMFIFKKNYDNNKNSKKYEFIEKYFDLSIG